MKCDKGLSEFVMQQAERVRTRNERQEAAAINLYSTASETPKIRFASAHTAQTGSPITLK